MPAGSDEGLETLCVQVGANNATVQSIQQHVYLCLFMKKASLVIPHLHGIERDESKVEAKLREPFDRCEDEEEAPERERSHSKEREDVVQTREEIVQEGEERRTYEEVHEDVYDPRDADE